MIKRFVIGAVLGVLGKKLYDEGTFDRYIARAKDKVDDLTDRAKSQLPGTAHVAADGPSSKANPLAPPVNLDAGS